MRNFSTIVNHGQRVPLEGCSSLSAPAFQTLMTGNIRFGCEIEILLLEINMNNLGQGAGTLSSAALPEPFSGIDKSHLDYFLSQFFGSVCAQFNIPIICNNSDLNRGCRVIIANTFSAAHEAGVQKTPLLHHQPAGWSGRTPTPSNLRVAAEWSIRRY